MRFEGFCSQETGNPSFIYEFSFVVDSLVIEELVLVTSSFQPPVNEYPASYNADDRQKKKEWYGHKPDRLVGNNFTSRVLKLKLSFIASQKEPIIPADWLVSLKIELTLCARQKYFIR